MAINCISLNPKNPRHKSLTVAHQAREVIDHFGQAAPPPAGGRLAEGKNADQAAAAAQALAVFLDAPDFEQRIVEWSETQPDYETRVELQPLAVDALRRWHEYLTQCGGYRLSHG